MYRVSPILLSFIPNILQTLHSAKSSSNIFTQNFWSKKFENFLSSSDGTPSSSLYTAFKWWDT